MSRGRHLWRRVSAAAWLLAGVSMAFSGEGRAANPAPLFRLFEMNDAREITEVTVADLNRDGKQDLLVVSRRGLYPNQRVALEVYLYENNGYPRYPQLIYHPQPDEIAFDVIPLAADAAPELVLMTPQGLRLRPGLWRGTSANSAPPQWLLKRPLLLQQPQKGSFFRFPLLHALGGSRSLVIAPASDGAWLFSPLKPKAVAHLRTEPRAFYTVAPRHKRFDVNYTLRARLTVPKVTVADHNGDGRPDLFFLWQEEIEVFEQKADGSFPGDASRTYFFNLLSDKERRRGEAVVNIDVVDLDGDSCADLVINIYRGSLTNLSARCEVLLRHPNAPEQKIEIPIESGDLAGALFADLTGDGKKDLILVRSPIGVLSIVRALLSKKIYLHFHVVPFNLQTLFRGDGTFNRRVSFDFNLADFQVVGFLPTLDGDFDGDGLPDALYALNEKEIRIDLSRPKTIFDPERALSFPVPPSKYYVVADLDGDGKSDILFFYPDGNQPGMLRALLNQGLRERRELSYRHGY